MVSAFAARRRDIARKIIATKAGYVLAPKGNRGALRAGVDLFVVEQRTSGFQDTIIARACQLALAGRREML